MVEHVEDWREGPRLTPVEPTCKDGVCPSGCSFSQCKTTVIFPLLSMIFQEGTSSCSPSAASVSQTILGMVDTTCVTISSPAGAHVSSGLSTRKIVFSGNVWKYSPSSTWVP